MGQLGLRVTHRRNPERSETMPGLETYVLTTARLGLRPHQPGDEPFMLQLNSDPEVVRYTGDGPFAELSEAEAVVASLARQYREERMGRFLAIELATGAPIGWCGLKRLSPGGPVDLGYRLLRSAWGRGLATEAARACVAYGFGELGLHRLIAKVAPDNLGSVRVVTKLGFQPCGWEPGPPLDFRVYELLAPGPR
jgi:RimJ/RimL family protein N-acetyltransferase